MAPAWYLEVAFQMVPGGYPATALAWGRSPRVGGEAYEVRVLWRQAPRQRHGAPDQASGRRAGAEGLLRLWERAAVSVLRFPVERRQPRRLVTLRELQEQFGMSERWWRYQRANGLPVHKWGSRLRFDPDEVVEWLDAQA